MVSGFPCRSVVRSANVRLDLVRTSVNSEDSTGDECDTDDDGDARVDDLDNCPRAANGDQTDFDADEEGDACDYDDDNDFCADYMEFGADPVFGGDRDQFDRWDFFDVTEDASIDLADALAILGGFGSNPGDPDYDASFDRDIPYPIKPWRTAAASGNGVGIDLADALNSLQPFGHSCVGYEAASWQRHIGARRI